MDTVVLACIIYVQYSTITFRASNMKMNKWSTHGEIKEGYIKDSESSQTQEECLWNDREKLKGFGTEWPSLVVMYLDNDDNGNIISSEKDNSYTVMTWSEINVQYYI